MRGKYIGKAAAGSEKLWEKELENEVEKGREREGESEQGYVIIK